jgi:hypothetical protein
MWRWSESAAAGAQSIDFHKEPSVGRHVRVNVAITGGSHDGLFFFTLGDHLGGIKYLGNSGEKDPAEFPGSRAADGRADLNPEAHALAASRAVHGRVIPPRQDAWTRRDRAAVAVRPTVPALP